MRRLRNDQGAVAVIVALMIVPLLACAALVIDVGALYVRRAELQNAADAGALAIAQDCAGGRPSCTTMAATASYFVGGNVSGGASAVSVKTGNSVNVTATSIVDYLFAPVIGIDSKVVTATSTASWGAPTGGRSILPITFSWCSFYQQTHGGIPTPTTQSIQFSKSDGTTCTGPSGNVVPGGFGWVKPDPGTTCTVTSSAVNSDLANTIYSDPGSSPPCNDSYFTAQLNKTVLLPLFAKSGGTGSGAWYQVYGYAAFRLTAFHFQGNNNWIKGYFLVFVEPSDAFTYGVGAPDLGARLVTLTG